MLLCAPLKRLLAFCGRFLTFHSPPWFGILLASACQEYWGENWAFCNSTKPGARSKLASSIAGEGRERGWCGREKRRERERERKGAGRLGGGGGGSRPGIAAWFVRLVWLAEPTVSCRGTMQERGW